MVQKGAWVKNQRRIQKRTAWGPHQNSRENLDKISTRPVWMACIRRELHSALGGWRLKRRKKKCLTYLTHILCYVMYTINMVMRLIISINNFVIKVNNRIKVSQSISVKHKPYSKWTWRNYLYQSFIIALYASGLLNVHLFWVLLTRPLKKNLQFDNSNYVHIIEICVCHLKNKKHYIVNTIIHCLNQFDR